MQGYCKLIVAGNVTRDAELRDGATPIAKFTVAVNEKRGQEESVTFFDCATFGKTAEVCAQYVKKGKPVLVEGKIRSRKYQGKDGTEKVAWEVAADRVVFLGGGKSDGEEGGGSALPF